MGKKKRRQQEDLWVATSELPRTAGHPFYERLNGLFNEHGFDDFVEGLCAKFYADKMGRPSLAPGVYFRLLLVGYFEGIGSERGIAWRAADSLALREFLGLKLSESPSDHSTISRTRRLIDVATHEAVFDWVLKRIGASGLLRGKTIGIDATTLEANAALRSIGADSEQGYEEFLMELAKASGIETPRREDLAKLDRKRTGKGSDRVEETRMMRSADYQNEGRADAPGAQGGACSGSGDRSDCLGDGTGSRSRGHADHGEDPDSSPRRWNKRCRRDEASKRWWPTRGITARSGWWTWMRWDCAAM